MKFLSFYADVAIAPFVIDEVIFMKITDDLTALLGLILPIRNVGIRFALLQSLEIFTGTVTGIGAALVDGFRQDLFGLLDHRQQLVNIIAGW